MTSTYTVQAFSDLVRDALDGADGIEKVQTFSDAGLDIKPYGVRVTCTDGTVYDLGIVRTAPPG